MNKAYETMRGFWLEVKNLQHKEEVPQLGAQKICVAGVEMTAADDDGKVKHLLITASSLGNASIYFENNSPSGLGGFTGGSASGPVREKSLRLLQTAAKLAEQLPTVTQLPQPTDPDQVVLFTVSADGTLRATAVAQISVRTTEHPLYGFFAYSQQLLGAFRNEQEKAAAAKEPPQTQAADTTEPKP